MLVTQRTLAPPSSPSTDRGAEQSVPLNREQQRDGNRVKRYRERIGTESPDRRALRHLCEPEGAERGPRQFGPPLGAEQQKYE
jgi:hypothetical protein